MVVIYVSVKTNEAIVTKFEDTLRLIVADARNVSGCLKYEWFRRPDASNHFVIYGEFESEEDFAAYHQSPVVERIESELIPMLIEPPSFKHFRATLMEAN